MRVKIIFCLCGLGVTGALCACLLGFAEPSTNWDNVNNAGTLLRQTQVGADEYRDMKQAEFEERSKAQANADDIQRTWDQKVEAEQEAAEEAEASELYQSYSDSSSYYSNSYGYENLGDIINAESGGDVYATNGQYMGIGQLSESYYETYLGQTWNQVAGDYEAQKQAMDMYVSDRYGSEEAAVDHWNNYGWY